MSALELVVPVMLGSGLVGGLINFFIADQDEGQLTWWKHVIIGVGASFTVPVFLNMISSALISEITGDLSDAKVISKLLVLAGFCLLAAVSSRAFLRSLSDRVLQDVKTAKKKAQEASEDAAEAKAVVAPLVEEEAPQEVRSRSSLSESVLLPVLTDDEKGVLRAMTSSRFSLRSISGLARDSGLTREAVNSTINSLLEKKMIAQVVTPDGKIRWYPTTLGRSVVSMDD